MSNTLTLIQDKVFKLDVDFDLLVDSQRLHILRPSGFEFMGELQEAILAAVPKNIDAIKEDLDFIDYSDIQEVASEHPRAARLLASIRTQEETKDIDKSLLKKLCKRTGVEVTESGGKIQVAKSNVIAFLEVIDRRRYELELVKGKHERYKASSRSKMQPE
jgi:hypothetical protein